MVGSIKRVVRDKGFGFILGKDGQEYFFHHTALMDSSIDTVIEGASVEFRETKGKNGKGPRAENVELR
jgi:CspA family cold shock protein